MHKALGKVLSTIDWPVHERPVPLRIDHFVFYFFIFFFIPETVLRRVQPELRMERRRERRRDKRREGVRVEKVQLGNFAVLIILKILLNSRSYFLSCTASPLLMLQCFIRAESPGR